MIFADSDWFTLKVYVGSFTLTPPSEAPTVPPATLLPQCLGDGMKRVFKVQLSPGREIRGSRATQTFQAGEKVFMGMFRREHEGTIEVNFDLQRCCLKRWRGNVPSEGGKGVVSKI